MTTTRNTFTRLHTLIAGAGLGALMSSAALAQTPPPAEAPQSALEDTDHAVKLRGLEERVNDLKERVFRSKAKLMLLRETVLNGVISGAKAVLVHRNEMGSSFALESMSYSLDGAQIFHKTNTQGELDER